MRTEKLELSAPLASLRKVAKLPETDPCESMTVDELAWARRVALGFVETDERKGGQIPVDALRVYVEMLGGTLEVRAILPDQPSEGEHGSEVST